MVAGYGAVQWVGPVLSLILTPIITRALTVDDYGASSYLQTIVTAVSTVAMLALPQAIATHFNDHPGEVSWQGQVAGSALAIVIVSGFVLGLSLVVAAPALGTVAPIVGTHVSLVQFLGSTLWISLAATVLVNAAQGALRVRWGIFLSMTSLASTVIFNLLLIVVLRLRVTGMLLAPLAVSGCVLVVALVLMRGFISRPSREALGLLLRSGIVLLPTTLSAWSLALADRLFLGQWVSEAELGYYDIANKIANLAYVAMAPIYTAWMPLTLAMQHHPLAHVRYVRMARYLVAAVLFIGLFLGLFAIEMLIVLTQPAYFPAAPYVGFLAYMHIFSAFSTVFMVGAMMGKQLRSVSVGVLLGALVNIALNIVLIPRFGLRGATVATMVGFAVTPLVLFVLVQRRYPLPYPIGRMVAALTVQFALLIAGLFVPAITFPVRVAIKLGILALLPVGFILVGMITLDELRQADAFVREYVARLLRSAKTGAG